MTSKRIIVPLDGSQLAEAALPWAEQLATALDAQIVVFRAGEIHMIPGVTSAESEVHALESAQQYLTGIVSRLTARGLKAWPLTAYGKPGDHIAAAARAHDAEMIVMSTHGRSGVSRWLMGSVADRVVHEATVPVVLVRGFGVPFEPWHRMLVPLDGSPLAELVLGPAVETAVALNMELVLLRVVQPHLSAIGGEMVAFSPEISDEETASAWQYLDSIAKDVRQRGVIVAKAVESGGGQAGELITGYAKENRISLIAMCSHCRSGISRFFLGSVASDVIHTSPVPVMLLNPRHHAGTPIASAVREANRP